MRYVSFDASFEGTADAGCKPARQGYLPGGLYLWMQKAIKSPVSKKNQCKSVSIRVKKNLSASSVVNKIRANPRNPRLNIMKSCQNIIKTLKFVSIRVNSWIKNFSATSVFSAVKYLVIIRVNSWLNVCKILYICRESSTNPPFLKKRTQFFPVFGPKTAILPKNEPKTNPKQTQFKADWPNTQNKHIHCIEKAL